MEHGLVRFLRAFNGHGMVKSEANAPLMRMLFALGCVAGNKIAEMRRIRIIVCVGYEGGKSKLGNRVGRALAENYFEIGSSQLTVFPTVPPTPPQKFPLLLRSGQMVRAGR